MLLGVNKETAVSKMTKAQLVDENIALRHTLDCLEAQIADLTHQLVVAKGAAKIGRAHV